MHATASSTGSKTWFNIELNNGMPFSARPAGFNFRSAEMPLDYYDTESFMAKLSISREEARAIVDENRKELVFRSDEWQVHIKPVDGKSGWPDMLHLNCRRTDRAPIHDWRALQLIKNILVGQEYEAVELYPAESRLTDMANNYHLWVLANPQARFPFGFSGRATMTQDEAAKIGAVQR